MNATLLVLDFLLAQHIPIANTRPIGASGVPLDSTDLHWEAPHRMFPVDLFQVQWIHDLTGLEPALLTVSHRYARMDM
jgi:hypothetical protein